MSGDKLGELGRKAVGDDGFAEDVDQFVAKDKHLGDQNRDLLGNGLLLLKSNQIINNKFEVGIYEYSSI